MLVDQNKRIVKKRFLKVTKFINKLYGLLETNHSGDPNQSIYWGGDGRCFVIPERKVFHSTMKETFNLTNYSSFIRQLNIYGFRKIKSRQGDVFKHFYFRKGNALSLIKIQRKTRNMLRTERDHKDELKVEQARLISRILFLEKVFKIGKKEGKLRERSLRVKRDSIQKKNKEMLQRCSWLRDMTVDLLND